MKSQVGGENMFPSRSDHSVTVHLNRHRRKARTFVSKLIHFKQEQNCVVVIALFINNSVSTCYTEHCAGKSEICNVLVCMSRDLKLKSVQPALSIP